MLALLMILSAVPVVELPLTDVAAVALGSDGSDRMTVKVKVDGSIEYPFVVDTGAERTVISRQLANRLKLVNGPIRNLVTVTGSGKVQTVIVPTLDVSGTRVHDIEAPALDQLHLGAPGMLGLDSLQTRRILLDFKKNEMRVMTARRVQDVDEDTIVVTARSRYGQLILVNSRLEGERVQVIIDTGAQTSIGNLALLKKLTARKRGLLMTPVTITSVTGGTLTAQFAAIKRIQIGGVDMNNIPVAFVDAEPFKRFGLANKPALLLGMDALRLFDRVSVDFANKEVRFVMPDSSALSGRTLLAAR